MANKPAPKNAAPVQIVETAPPPTLFDILAQSCSNMGQLFTQLGQQHAMFQQGLMSLSGGINVTAVQPLALPAPVGHVPTQVPAAAPVTAAPPPKNRPTGTAPAAVPAAATTTPAAPAAAAPVTPVKPTERNYDNEMSLVQAVYEILDRKENAEGLKVTDIVKTIKEEGKWVSSSDNINNQVQGAVYTLKDAGKLVRGDERKYYVPEGATPPEGRKKAAAATA